MNDTHKFLGQLSTAVDVADQLTPSVLALAIVEGISAKELSKTLADSDTISQYRVDVTMELQKLYVARAVEEAKEEEEAKKAGK
jgi:hypothetical protein